MTANGRTGSMTRRAFVAAMAAGGALGLIGGCGRDAGGSGDGGAALDGAGSPSQVQGPPPAADPAPSAGEPVAGDVPEAAIPSPDLESRVAETVAALTIEQKVGQLFIVRPESIVNADASIPDDYLDGVSMPDETFAAAYGEVLPAGVCLFDKNLLNPDQTRLFTRAVDSMSRDRCGVPAFIAVDEEGGSVARIANNPAFGVANVGSAADIGATGDARVAYDAGALMAGYLSQLGFNLDFAPVCDIVSDPGSSAMAGRSFGAAAEAVCPMVDATVAGLLDGGLMCAAKHFPGIGDARGDSHEQSIYTYASPDEMAGREWLPFRTAIERSAPFIMVGHIVCTAAGSDLPASVDPVVVGEWLRGRLGYQGVVITDSLEMESIASRLGWDGAAVAALQAGVDVVLLPVNLRVAMRGVLDALADGRLTQERVDESVARVVRAKLQWDDRMRPGA